MAIVHDLMKKGDKRLREIEGLLSKYDLHEGITVSEWFLLKYDIEDLILRHEKQAVSTEFNTRQKNRESRGKHERKS